jgi:starch synthase
MRQSLKVLFLAAEADPFVKIGGLGDVAGSLPAALRAITPDETGEPDWGEIDVRLVLPFHGAIQRQSYPFRTAAVFEVPHAGGPIRAEALTVEMNGVPVYFIAGPPISPDAPVYTADPSVDGVKFTFFSLAALELARNLGWSPHIVHANDWHTSPALYSLYLNRERDPFYYNTAALLGLHNLPYLGLGAGPALASFGLQAAAGSPLPDWAQDLPLPLGLLSADHIVAASPTYAREIMTPEFGSGLESFLRGRAGDISGILNGIDTDRWDPATDPVIHSKYDLESLAGRPANKKALQEELDLQPDPDCLLFGMVTRMDNQKGIDLAPDALRRVAGSPWQAVILGTGDPALEAAMRRLETEFPDRVRAVIRFDAALSHRIYAGADALLIPSRYEPCGLTQMIAMRYGCVPVARAVGGLRDTIQDHTRSDHSTGFLFKMASSEALASALRRALRAYPGRAEWQLMQQRGMAQDFSWRRFARQYFALYSRLVRDRASIQAASGTPPAERADPMTEREG